MSTSSPDVLAIGDDAIASLRRQLDGAISLPGDASYSEARTLWNGLIDKRPQMIVHPRGVSDILHTLIFAREQELPLSIKGGGHNVAGHALSDGGITLAMGSMRAVRVDPVGRTARVEAGATWADFDRETGVFGLATTGGAISTTGVAGLTLGGGVGWLVGKHGLAIDNLRSVDVITADGDVLTASAGEHPDLFWALRGGGGNLGVVTSFEFDVHPLEQVLAGMVAYPAAQAREVLSFYREITEAAPDELTIYCSVMGEPESGTRVIGMAICWSGDLEEGERVLQPVLAFGAPLLQMIGPMPYPVWQSANNPLFPHGRRYYWKGTMLPSISDRTIDAIVELATDPPLPWLNATIEFYAGAMNRIDPASSAYPHRSARYQLLAIGAWDDRGGDETGIGWARALHAAATPASTGGSFLNFVSEDGSDRTAAVRAGYGASWDRLRAVKRRYDPTNVFRHNNNIVP